MAVVDLTPEISNVRALVTTKWGKRGYGHRTMRNVVSYYVDSALDSDADQWAIEIADPELEYPQLVERDNEVRVQLYGAGGAGYVMTGIADEVNWDDGVHKIDGRDLSALAIDSVCEPGVYRHIRADRLVAQQAKKIGFENTALSATGPNGKIYKKLQRTDGSESYWEFWYRLYRREKMWLWTEANGQLIASTLNYSSDPSYFFGSPRSQDKGNVAKQYIPVESLSIKKSTTGRFEEVWVGGHKGTNGFWRKANDPTIAGWKMKRRKFVVDKDAHTWNAAITAAWEEIFEGKVGALEIALTILDPGFIVRQNNIAIVNIPTFGLTGDFFVVGSRLQGGPDGFVQEVRLRQRNYAVTRRVPDPPAADSATKPPSTQAGATGLAEQLAAAVDMPTAWGTYFTVAARRWCGPWDFNLFLACLLAMCSGESTFRNIRQHPGGNTGSLPGRDNVEWYPRPSNVPAGTAAGVARAEGTTVGEIPEKVSDWEKTFANEPGVYGITSPYVGVGPMQLTSIGLKHQADDRLRPNFRNQFEGGRWHPEHNIWVSAKFLRECLQIVAKDSGRDMDIWGGVGGYNGGPGNPNYTYALSVKALVNSTYLPAVKTARDAAQAAAKVDPGDSDTPKGGYVNSPQELAKLKWVVKSYASTDIAHVDYRLLSALNALGRELLRTISINSGFRTYAEQQAAYADYKRGGNRAAVPGTSNHEFGWACDAVINGIGIRTAAGPVLLAKHHLAANIGDEDWHVTLDSIPNAGH